MTLKKLSAISTDMPISVATAKAQCRIDCDEEDALIGAYISVAVEHAANKLQRALVPARYQLVLDAFPCGNIELRMPPIISVESVVYTDEQGAQQTLSSNVYGVDTLNEPAAIYLKQGNAWPATQEVPSAVVVSYTAGYAADELPTPIRQWLLLCVSDMYENRSRSAERPVVAQGFADSLLEPYQVWSV